MHSKPKPFDKQFCLANTAFFTSYTTFQSFNKANCSNWYVDGTFKSAASTLFSQIVFIVELNGLGKSFPYAFALLPNKGKDSYLHLAACIRDELTQLPEVKV